MRRGCMQQSEQALLLPWPLLPVVPSCPCGKGIGGKEQGEEGLSAAVRASSAGAFAAAACRAVLSRLMCMVKGWVKDRVGPKCDQDVHLASLARAPATPTPPGPLSS